MLGPSTPAPRPHRRYRARPVAAGGTMLDMDDDSRETTAPQEPTATSGAWPAARPETEHSEQREDVEPHEDTAQNEDTAQVPDATFVGHPAKVMRIGTMIKQLLEEVRSAPLDEAARGRLAEVHDRSLRELEDGLSPDLVAELRRISLPFSDDANPSESELRVAQAQLVGWLEGLFHGLQTALVAQQMSTQVQLAQMRRALPPGTTVDGAVRADVIHQAARHAGAPEDDRRAPGQYL